MDRCASGLSSPPPLWDETSSKRSFLTDNWVGLFSPHISSSFCGVFFSEEKPEDTSVQEHHTKLIFCVINRIYIHVTKVIGRRGNKIRNRATAWGTR